MCAELWIVWSREINHFQLKLGIIGGDNNGDD